MRLASVGLVISLRNSFIASARGWGIPAIPTLLGPFRNWIYPKIFRSRSVKNAIAAKAMIIVIIGGVIEENIIKGAVAHI